MKNNKKLPVIGVTMGDPVGIGPEILVKALSNTRTHQVCRPIVIGDVHVMEKAVRLCKSTLGIRRLTSPARADFNPNHINILEIPDHSLEGVPLETASPKTGAAMQAYILKGIDLTLKNEIQGLVTCPITKTAMKLAGSAFHGHTELLFHHTGAGEYAMMLAGDRLKVVLVTIHIPLSKVIENLTTGNILKTIDLTHRSLKQRFGIQNPRIAVAGLNPHAGEDDMFGTEESQIIRPAVELAKQKNIDVQGPLPPDTVFYKAVNGQFDAVVCMYHDQGLIPFKLIHFEDGVNTTLGLPIIRTSVDHGTAYDIAWKGIADPASLIEAIKMAGFQASNS